VTAAKDHATGDRILEIEVRGKRRVGYCNFADRGAAL
jgi:hypothetical protein